VSANLLLLNTKAGVALPTAGKLPHVLTGVPFKVTVAINFSSN
jgi:hypothetical protein